MSSTIDTTWAPEAEPSENRRSSRKKLSRSQRRQLESPDPRARLRRRRPRGFWRVLGWTGYALMLLGVITLLFVVYTLWGTRLQTAQAQAELKDDFAEQTQALPGPAPADLLESVEAEWDTALPGGAIARIQIPKLGVDSIVVAGTERDPLKKGPGAWEYGSLPGAPGNSTISGHRTTYGAEFNRLDELVAGDEIIVTTVAGESVYHMRDNEVVVPSDVSVTDQNGANELTLTTCHPKFSAAERLIVHADMVSGPFMDLAAPAATEIPADAQVEGGI